jgi:CubicO group peptidase (beta-lactamase class C family)
MKAAPFFLMAMSSVAPSAQDYAAEIRAYEVAVREEMQHWNLAGVAVAWIDGTDMVHQAGYGEAEKDSVFRAGSVSKLFNAIVVKQLVEQGKLDLDAPLSSSRLPVNPFNDAPVTLRQLLCHRSGLQRESPTGGYFDDREPSLEATVASLRGSALVSPPDTENRYSNVGPSLAGQLAAEAVGRPFHELATATVLKPLGMERSAWHRRDVPEVIASHLRIADGRGGYRTASTPLFDLGTIPAGNLYATAGDLGRFVVMLAAGGDAAGGRIVKESTLQEMWKPQLDPRASFGIGFALG